MALVVSGPVGASPLGVTQRISALVETALRGLPKMIDQGSGLFAFTTGPGGPRGRSIRYTCMSLLGLAAAARAGLNAPISLDRLADALVRHRRDVECLGDLGLLLWCLAEFYELVNPVQEEVLSQVEKESRRLRMANTSELAWLLTGLCRTVQAGGSEAKLRTLATETYRALRNNYSDSSGLFCYGGVRGNVLRRWLRRRLGFFDNQVYGIYAGATYYEVFGDRAALWMADGCARRICALQGPLGQWAWHYNVMSAQVVDRHPVYSVHQDGMAPMALGVLKRVSGEDYRSQVARGVDWLFGGNELGRNLVDRDGGLIWRSIRRKLPYHHLIYPFKFLSLFRLDAALDGIARVANVPSRLEIDLECRPYHFGWLLLAFAEQAHSWA